MGINFYTQTTSPVEKQVKSQRMPSDVQQRVKDLTIRVKTLEKLAELQNRDPHLYAETVCEIDSLKREIQTIEQKYSGYAKSTFDVVS